MWCTDTEGTINIEEIDRGIDWKEVVPDFNSQTNNPTNTTPIPIKMDLKMDGIGGIRIGDVVKIHNPEDNPRLPRGYLRDDVHWVVFGDSHNITAGQDWAQQLTLQLTLMGNGYQNISSTPTTVDEENILNEIERGDKDAIGNKIAESPQEPPPLSTYATHWRWVNPVKHEGIGGWTDEQNFGIRTIGNLFHNGVDLIPKPSKNGGSNQLGVYMPHTAQIIEKKFTSGTGCGNELHFEFIYNFKARIHGSDDNEATGYSSLGTDPANKDHSKEGFYNGKIPRYGIFCHLKDYNTHRDGTELKIGDIIFGGERVGTMGKTGTSGVHLHYGLHGAIDAGADPNIDMNKWLGMDDLGTLDFHSYDEETTHGVDPAYFLSVNDNLTEYIDGAHKGLGGGGGAQTYTIQGLITSLAAIIPEYDYYMDQMQACQYHNWRGSDCDLSEYPILLDSEMENGEGGTTGTDKYGRRCPDCDGGLDYPPPYDENERKQNKLNRVVEENSRKIDEKLRNFVEFLEGIVGHKFHGDHPKTHDGGQLGLKFKMEYGLNWTRRYGNSYMQKIYPKSKNELLHIENTEYEYHIFQTLMAIYKDKGAQGIKDWNLESNSGLVGGWAGLITDGDKVIKDLDINERNNTIYSELTGGGRMFWEEGQIGTMNDDDHYGCKWDGDCTE